MKRYAEFAAIAQEQIEGAMKQEEVLDACAQVMTDTVMHDGVIHVFGCGHSQMFAEELCFRTGGLVPVNAIIIPHYHIFPRVRYSQLMERCEGFAPAVLDTMTTSSADTMIIVSVSGRNAAGIDMAMAAKEKGMKVIGLFAAEEVCKRRMRARGDSKEAVCERVEHDRIAFAPARRIASNPKTYALYGQQECCDVVFRNNFASVKGLEDEIPDLVYQYIKRQERV